MLGKRLTGSSIVLAVVLIAFLVILSFGFGSDGPAYEGKSALGWLAQLDEYSGSRRDEARSAFAAMGAAAVPWLQAQLNADEPAPWLRWKFDYLRQPGKKKILTMTAATALGSVGPAAQSAIPDLKRLSTDPVPWVRGRAKAALILIEEQSLEPLNRELQGVAKTTKWNDLPQILSGLGSASLLTIPTLISLAEHSDADVSCQAIRLLGELRLSPETAVPALARRLSSKNDNQRFAAATALAAYGLASRSASAALIQALGDKWDYVAGNAISAIEQFADAPEAKGAVPKLQQLLTHQNDSLRISSARTLAKIQKRSGLEQ